MLRRLRNLACACAVLVTASLPVTAQTTGTTTSTFQIPKSTYTPPKTPWGDPDLQGLWDNYNVIPVQRPANLAGKKYAKIIDQSGGLSRAETQQSLTAPASR